MLIPPAAALAPAVVAQFGDMPAPLRPAVQAEAAKDGVDQVTQHRF